MAHPTGAKQYRKFNGKRRRPSILGNRSSANIQAEMANRKKGIGEVRVQRRNDGYAVVAAHPLGHIYTVAAGLPEDAAIERAEVEAAERCVLFRR